MFGLTVRWSLIDAPADTLQRLTDYVAEESFEKFSQLDDLHYKLWRTREGEWFEGTYVFSSESAREKFQVGFQERVESVPVTGIVGKLPVIEPFYVVAVAVGPAGAKAAARFQA